MHKLKKDFPVGRLKLTVGLCMKVCVPEVVMFFVLPCGPNTGDLSRV